MLTFQDTTRTTTSLAKSLQCPSCHKEYDLYSLQSYATCCNQPLITQYEVEPLSKELLVNRPHTMWRYLEVLPVFDEKNIVSLGEGWTPIYTMDKLSSNTGISSIMIKR